MLRFKQETGKEITEIDPSSFTDLCTYLWCCVVAASKREGKEFGMSLIDFADGITPEDMAQWNAAISADTSVDDTDNGEKKSVGVYDLLGMAVGCIGVSYDDFCKFTFDEFESICKAWSDMTESRCKEGWERTRTLVAICIQPHVRKRITPGQLLPLPWDNKKSINHPNHQPQLSADERKDRFKQLSESLSH